MRGDEIGLARSLDGGNEDPRNRNCFVSADASRCFLIIGDKR